MPKPAFIGGKLPLFILAFLLGVLVYFALPTEPRLGHIISLSIGGVFMAGLFFVLNRYHHWFWLGGHFVLWVVVFASGLAYSTWHTSHITTPFWPEHLSQQRVWVNGVVEEVNLRHNGFATVRLKGVTSYHSNSTKTWPRMVIITHNSRAEEARAGGTVAAQVRLRPPHAVLHKSQYDWRQRSFFEEVSAAGFVMGDFYTTKPIQAKWPAFLRALREDVAQELKQNADSQTHSDARVVASGVGAALLTGLRGGISPKLRENYANSGLAHLMAISGMHLGMVAGFVYFLMRFLLVRAGHLPLALDIRKPAALCAFMAAVGYALLAGATIPTIRALGLIAAAFIAVLFDRLHLGIRILALVALALALYQPFWVWGASFQLSFAASFGLLLWAYQRKIDAWHLGALTPKRNKGAELFKASVIATLATAPLVAVHFGAVPLLGAFANMVAIPLLGLAVLPLGFLWLLLPSGLNHFVGEGYLYSIMLLNKLANTVASSPLSTLELQSYMVPFLFVLCWGMLMALLWRSGRLFMIALLAGAPLFVGLHKAEHPVVLVTHKAFIGYNGEAFTVFGTQDRPHEYLAKSLPKPVDTEVWCDSMYCVYGQDEGAGVPLLLGQLWADISLEDCRHSQWVLTQSHTIPCPEKNLKNYLTTHHPATGYDIFLKENNTLYVRLQKLTAQRPWHGVRP